MPHPLLDDAGRGRDPLKVPVSDLKDAGLGPLRASAVIGRYNRTGGHSYDAKCALTGLRDLLCKPCTERDSWSFGGGEHVSQVTAIRQCAVLGCPVWPYRMGRNPFSARRGKTPTFGRAAS